MKRRYGQTLVLGCITLLVLAVMLMLSLNITNAIHEKIRLQNHADAQAYSVAVLEARAYNSLAYSNRAIASAFVAQMSVHAWMAVATQAAANHQAFAMAFGVAAAFETALGCYPYNFSHCFCVFRAGINAIRHLSKSRTVGNKVKDNEDAFNNAVQALSTMIRLLHAEQTLIVNGTNARAIQVINKLKQTNLLPDGQNSMPVAALNSGHFTCPLEGVSAVGIGGNCSGSSKNKEERSKIMAHVANGSRHNFAKGSANPILFPGVAHIGTDYMMNSNYLKGLQNNSGTNTITFGVRAAAGTNNSGSASAGQNLEKVSAGTTTTVVTVLGWQHTPVAVGMRSSSIASDHSRGHHSMGHDPDHDKLPYCAENDCFVNFKMGNSGSDYNQPSTFGGATQDLRKAPHATPWEINSQGKITMDIDNGGQLGLTLVPTKRGIAVGKGKVYFHQLGNWRVPPNLFDPLWRAKLHGFKDRQELMQTAGLAAATGGGVDLLFPGPVEGIE